MLTMSCNIHIISDIITVLLLVILTTSCNIHIISNIDECYQEIVNCIVQFENYGRLDYIRPKRAVV